MNSVSTATNSAPLCRAQNCASASVSVMTVMADAIPRKPGRRKPRSLATSGSGPLSEYCGLKFDAARIHVDRVGRSGGADEQPVVVVATKAQIGCGLRQDNAPDDIA